MPPDPLTRLALGCIVRHLSGRTGTSSGLRYDRNAEEHTTWVTWDAGGASRVETWQLDIVADLPPEPEPPRPAPLSLGCCARSPLEGRYDMA